MNQTAIDSIVKEQSDSVIWFGGTKFFYLTHMNGQHAARNELVVVRDSEVPRLDSHEVIEGEHQNQTALCAHLGNEHRAGTDDNAFVHQTGKECISSLLIEENGTFMNIQFCSRTCNNFLNLVKFITISYDKITIEYV